MQNRPLYYLSGEYFISHLVLSYNNAYDSCWLFFICCPILLPAAFYTDPLYVSSPYGNWLTEQEAPHSSDMSDWFREKYGTNIVINGNVLFEWKADDGVHRYATFQLLLFQNFLYLN